MEIITHWVEIKGEESLGALLSGYGGVLGFIRCF